MRNASFWNRSARAGRVPTGVLAASALVGVVLGIARYRPLVVRLEKRLAAVHYELLDLRARVEDDPSATSAPVSLPDIPRSTDPLRDWFISNGDAPTRSGTYG